MTGEDSDTDLIRITAVPASGSAGADVDDFGQSAQGPAKASTSSSEERRMAARRRRGFHMNRQIRLAGHGLRARARLGRIKIQSGHSRMIINAGFRAGDCHFRARRKVRTRNRGFLRDDI